MVQQRQVAFKVWISDLVNGKYTKEEGEWDPNYVLIKGNIKVSRVNIIASVVNKYKSENSDYSYITLDDGTSDVNVKAWREDIEILNKCDIGDLILLIGRVKEYSGEIYITSEIIKKLDNPNWAKIRKLELEREFGKPSKIEEKKEIQDKKIIVEVKNGDSIIVKEEFADGVLTQTNRQKVLSYISKKEEVTYDEIIENLGLDEKEVEGLIKELLKEGEIYQPKPNYLKVI